MLRTRAAAGTVTAALVIGVTAATVPSSASVQPGQLYVAPWGKDTWPGTVNQPFATAERAQKAVRARTARMASDIVVNFRVGTYRLKASLNLTEAEGDSGRNGHRVIYQAYGYGTPRQEKVTISGGRQVTGWQPDRQLKGYWRADVGGLDTRQLYVNDKRATRLVRGNSGLAGKLKLTENGYTTTSAIPKTWSKPRDIEFVYRYGYLEGRCGVAGISSNSKRTTITMDQPCWQLARGLYGADALKEWFEVENSTSFPHKPGSWYLDRSRPGRHVLLYRPRPGEDMRRVQAIVPVVQTLVSGTGRPGRPLHDVAFKGLTFAHATWLEPSQPAGFPAAWSMYVRPGNGEDGTLLTVPGNIAFRTTERITVEGNRFVHLGAQALEFSKNSSYNVINGNVITDVSDGGILMGVVVPDLKGINRGNRITNNWIHGTGADYRASSAIWDTATQETTIAHNQVNDVPYTGILSGPSDDLRDIMRGNRILNNRVFRTNRLLADGGGIYLRGEQGKSFTDGAVISGNAVTDSKFTPEWNVGIYTDDSSNWMTVDRNVVHDYVASIGGCSEEWGNRPVQNVRYRGNFWDDAVPEWLKRREFPGAWPPADEQNPEQGCGDPHKLEFAGNTLLPAANPGQACAGNPGCAAIVRNAGLLPPYRHLLSTP
ncbi:right-handed parallel beta-helix repeat-containing protein [Actinomadura rudentiformis]|uniref:Right-handed parallel beta-helix repeat-containing protein n=1 Tax=Actinomadura rudentiformis TaxID=359158 RepID=A0A6H9Z936_9ACTN|nr:right-handed parallel beta-helix repeat-containing protein [Actinomadura rudentiformis]